MPIEFSSPDGLAPGVPYHHVAVATGRRHIHIAGQVGGDADGRLSAPGDLAGQVTQALRNVATALAGVGASFTDVVRLTCYVARWTPDQMGDFMRGVQTFTDEANLPSTLPPASLIGVEALFEPDILVEIEATAVAD